MSLYTVVESHLLIMVMITLLVLDTSEATTCSQLCHYVPWARDADCSRRHLQEIPVECIGSKVLNLNKNNITEIPSRGFSGFENLKYLQLLESNVHMIADNSFAGATKLKSVNLLKNALRTIPAHALNDTIGLRSVYFSRNQITTIELGVFQGSPLIEMVFLDFNHLKHLEGGIFQGLFKMQRLSLGNNQLWMLPTGVFGDLVSLNHLDLSGNQLRTLSVDIFSGLEYLQTIELSGNRLVDILPGTFSFSQVSHLDIADNNLTNLMWNQAEFGSLEDIAAAGNPWICDCSLDLFRAALVELTVGSGSAVLCSEPRSNSHTNITSHSTFCQMTTSEMDVAKTRMRSNSDESKVNMHNAVDMVDEVVNTDVVVDGYTPAMITLIAVVTVTTVALLGMGVFLFVTIILPKLCRVMQVSYDIKTTCTEVTADVPKQVPTSQV